MSKPSKLPEIDPTALREHGTEEQVDRIWRQLEADLATEPVRSRTALWWAPATAVILFGSGVFVGARWGRSEPPVAATTVQAEAPREEPASGPELPFAPVLDPLAPEEPKQSQPRRMPRHNASMPEPEDSSSAVMESSPPTASLPPAAVQPEWQRLAQQGEYLAARQAVERIGGFDAAIANASADQLMILVDVARATGQRGRAVQALRRVVDQFPGDPNAPLAAWTLGTILERAGDRAGAAKAYAAYRALSPKGDFAEDALARQVEAAVQAGNLESARKLAQQYEKDFPKGRRLRDIRAQVAKLAGEAAPETEGDGGAARSEDETPSTESEDEAPASGGAAAVP
ncbi:MAG: tetratricopeptide repeat protein [Myxococcales bacterium]|nr:tetratricopeptide repeat protein [Myxococcales bacterium]MCB9581759.1 tetratricopeptide repeat protein [Polyangiaceae bacterium]